MCASKVVVVQVEGEEISEDELGPERIERCDDNVWSKKRKRMERKMVEILQ